MWCWPEGSCQMSDKHSLSALIHSITQPAHVWNLVLCLSILRLFLGLKLRNPNLQDHAVTLSKNVLQPTIEDFKEIFKEFFKDLSILKGILEKFYGGPWLSLNLPETACTVLQNTSSTISISVPLNSQGSWMFFHGSWNLKGFQGRIKSVLDMSLKSPLQNSDSEKHNWSFFRDSTISTAWSMVRLFRVFMYWSTCMCDCHL